MRDGTGDQCLDDPKAELSATIHKKKPERFSHSGFFKS
jgi:hypothetical protein